MFKRLISIVLIFSLSLLGFVRCMGSFALFRKVNQIIAGLTEYKFLNWVIFLVCWFFFVYGIIILVDLVILNSIEFWTGSSVISFDYDENGEHQRVAERGNERAVFTYRRFGAELQIELYKDGRLVKTIMLKRDDPGVVYAVNNGRLEMIDVTVRDHRDRKLITLLEGSRIVSRKTINRYDYAQRRIQSDNLLARIAYADRR